MPIKRIRHNRKEIIVSDNLVVIERIKIIGMGASDNPTQYIRVPQIFRSKTEPGDEAVFKQKPGSDNVYVDVEKAKR